MLRTLLSVALLLLLGACAFGNTIDYRSQPLELAAKTDKPVVVGVDDKRPYVVSKDNTPEFVGVIRSAGGIPYGVHTTSGKPLAADFSASIVKALGANGVSASEVTILVSATADTGLKALTGTGAQRCLLVTIVDWKSDKYFNTTLTYALKADVFDAAGKVIASNAVQGTTPISGDISHPTENLERNATGIAQKAMKQLLDDSKILEALR